MWVTIILALIQFFASYKGKKENLGKAALSAAAVGAGTYYLTHNTDILPDSVRKLDGWTPETLPNATAVNDGTATAAQMEEYNSAKANAEAAGATYNQQGVLQSLVTTTGQVLTSWGAAGTAGVVGTTALATSSSLQKYLPWIIGGLAVVLIMK